MKRLAAVAVSFFLAVPLLGALPAAAATFDYFLKIDGIPGESTSQQHRDEIDVLSLRWGVSNAGGGGAGGGGAGKPVFEPFNWTQFVDRAVPRAFEALVNGERIPEAVLSVDTGGTSGKPVPFFRMTFDDVRIIDLDITGSGGSAPLADLAFVNSGRILMEYFRQRSDGTRETVKAEWDPKAGLTGDTDALIGLFSAVPFSFDLPEPAAVPEPSTYALLGAGLLMLGAAARRRLVRR